MKLSAEAPESLLDAVNVNNHQRGLETRYDATLQPHQAAVCTLSTLLPVDMSSPETSKQQCTEMPCRPSERGEDWHSVTSHLSSSSFAWDTQSQGSRQSNASAASSQVRMQAVHSRLVALAQYLSFACMPRRSQGTQLLPALPA